MSFRKVSTTWIHPRHIGEFGFYPVSTALLVYLAFSPAVDSSSFLVPAAVAWLLVLVHELGHAAAASASGFSVVRICAYPIYGMTRIHRPATRNGSFGWLATVIAGPAAGAGASLLALAVLAALRATAHLPSALDGPAFEGILIAGLLDQVINLLPLHAAFDGARARGEIARLRALRAADAGVRRLRNAAAVPIQVPPPEREAVPASRRAA
jgi:hypothetical protein